MKRIGTSDGQNTSADYTYEVTIVATDPGRPDETPKGPKLSATFPVTITVTNVNEAPMFLNEASDGVYVYEGVAGQEVIDSKEVLTAKDEDINDSFTYRLDVNSGQFFAIDPTTGVLTTKVELDFDLAEPTLMYTVTVYATDAGGAASSKTVTIDLKNVSGDETG